MLGMQVHCRQGRDGARIRCMAALCGCKEYSWCHERSIDASTAHSQALAYTRSLVSHQHRQAMRCRKLVHRALHRALMSAAIGAHCGGGGGGRFHEIQCLGELLCVGKQSCMTRSQIQCALATPIGALGRDSRDQSCVLPGRAATSAECR